MSNLQQPGLGIGRNNAPSVGGERAGREGAVDSDDGLLAVTVRLP